MWSCFLLVFEGMYIKLTAEIKDLNVTKEKKNTYKKIVAFLQLLLLNFRNEASSSYKGAFRW